MIKKVVLFKINCEDFAVDIMDVERILGYIEPTHIPESPSHVKGVIQYHEKILPVMDIKKRFGLSDNSKSSDNKIVVVGNKTNKVGIIVDEVTEVIDTDKDKIEDAPDMIRGIKNNYVKGIINKDNRIITLIDTQQLFTKEELDNLNIYP